MMKEEDKIWEDEHLELKEKIKKMNYFWVSYFKCTKVFRK